MDTRVRRYDDAEKLQLIAEYMHSGESMESFQVKYGMGHCTLSRWIAKFGMSNTSVIGNFVSPNFRKVNSPV